MTAALPRSEMSRLQLAIERAGGPEAFLRRWVQLDEEKRQVVNYNWRFLARPKQLAPDGEWSTWHLRAGRGFGKTRTGAEWLREKARQGGHWALVAPTAADARDVMVEGVSGILAISPPWERPLYEPSKRRLTWPWGARATLYSAEEPDRLRGPQHDGAWGDEIAAWARREETWDMLQFGLRAGSHPQCVLTSTPRGLKFLRDIEADPSTIVTVGNTYENRHNLASTFVERIEKKYAGTRLGQQEIEAQILDDNPGALWKRKDIDRKRITLAELQGLGVKMLSVEVGLDPATTSHAGSCQNGIIAAGSGMCSCNGTPELHGFVFEDASDIYTPLEVCTKVLDIYERRGCKAVVGETNQGGDWIESLLRTLPAGKRMAYRGVHAKDGKRLRAEPVSSLYEQGRVHHVGYFNKLEDQMTAWDPNGNEASPDDMDAMVHVLTDLLCKDSAVKVAGFSGNTPQRERIVTV
jgi:predicted phage terminase large subunit-like protein